MHNNIYIQFDKDNKFSGFNIQMLQEKQKYKLVIDEETKQEVEEPDGFEIVALETLPENACVITSEQHEEYLTALNSQLKDIVLSDGNIKIVDKIIDAERKAERDKQELIAQSQQLLAANDYRQTKALLGLYTDEKKESVLNYMESLREVIRQAREGILTELPTQTF
jgi:DNA polymerase elongation subunit (family B)